MNILLNRGFGFSLLRTQFNANKVRNAFRFENQNLTWTFEEFESQSNAVAYGLVEQGYKANDKILLLLGKSNTAESASLFVGAAKAGVVTVPFRASTYEQLEQTVRSVNPTGIYFSPNMKFQDGKFVDAVQKLFPESKTNLPGDILKTATAPNLRWLVHTGFYSYPGTYKFRQSLVYASKNFNRLSLPQVSDNQVVVSEVNGKTYTVEQLNTHSTKLIASGTQNVVVTGDPQTTNAFSAVVGTLSQGYFSVFTGSDNPQQLSRVLSFYPNSALIFDSQVYDQNELSKLHLQEQAQKNLTQVYVTGGAELEQFKSVFNREVSAI